MRLEWNAVIQQCGHQWCASECSLIVDVHGTTIPADLVEIVAELKQVLCVKG